METEYGRFPGGNNPFRAFLTPGQRRERTRRLVTPIKGVTFIRSRASTNASWSKWTETVGGENHVGGQVTLDYGTNWNNSQWVKRHHPKLHKTLKLNERDHGSEFMTQTSYVGPRTSVYMTKSIAANVQARYEGNLTPVTMSYHGATTLNPQITSEERARLNALGSTAIAIVKPDHPVSGLANFLGELRRDGLPSLPGLAMRDRLLELKRTQRYYTPGRNTIREGSSEYLNYVFAITPALNDVRSFASAVTKSDKLLAQYMRDSGKGIRRGYRFPTTTEETKQVVSTNYPPQGGHGPSTWFSKYGTLTKYESITRDAWFSGCFTYYLPMGDSVVQQSQLAAKKANYLLGIRPDLEVLWNLAPWSWAADWFSNTGHVVSNANSALFDGLVMRYGYVMETTTTVTTYVLDGYQLAAGVSSSHQGPITLQFTQQRKLRTRATPFGFGLSDGDLSPRQKAIIAALGLSRGGGRQAF